MYAHAGKSGQAGTPAQSLRGALARRARTVAVAAMMSGLVIAVNAKSVLAATCTWTGAISSTFSQNGNWSSGACGGGPPDINDTAQFTSGSVACNITANASVAAFTINGYTGTITQSAGAALTVTGNLTQSSGTFTGGNSTIDIGGSFLLSNGTFTSTSGRLEVGGAFTKTGGTFNHGSGQVMLNPTSSQTFASQGATFYDLNINDGLVGYWPVDTGSGSAATDRSGYGNSGTLSNTTWVTAAGDLPSALDFKNDAALSFNGSTSSSTLGVTGFSALNGSYTVSMWVHYASIPATQQTFISIASGTNRNQIGFFDNAGARTIRMWKRLGTTNTSLVTASSTPASGWHHVVYTFNGSTHMLYVDGASATSSTSPAIGTPDAATLGMRTDAAEHFSGRIDDVRIYKRVLSPTEVGRLHTGGQPQTSAVTQTLTGAPTVANDLIIASGTLAAGSNGITVGGSWWNYGGLFSGTGTVTLNGSGTTNVVRSGGQSFGALIVSGSGTWTLGDEVSMATKAITVNAGALTGLSFPIRAGTITEPGGNFTPGTGAVTLDGSSSVTLPDGSYGALSIEFVEPGLAGYWKLDEGTGSSFSDSSGYGNHGTLFNSPTWSTDVAPAIDFTDPASLSIAGGATNDHGTANVTSLNLNVSSNITIAYWMYYASIPGGPTQNAITIKRSGAGWLQTGFLNSAATGCNDGSLCLAVWNSGEGTTPRAFTNTVPAAGWHHFAYTWDGTNSTLYIDGSAAHTTTNAPFPGTAETLYISTYDGANEDYSGRIDEVRLYSAALTPTQVQELAGGSAAAASAPTYTLGGNTNVSGAFSLSAGTLAVGSRTLTASSGLTVGGAGTLTMATTGGILAIGSGQSLIMNGTLNASSTGATIQSVSGNYAFQVGSTSTATPRLNITGLAVRNTDTNGMYVNAVAGSSTTFTRFDNIAFSSGTGNQLLQISAPSLYLTSNGCTFDSGTSASTTYSVTLAGNGVSDGETRAVFGGSTCATSFASCQASKNDDDSDNDGVGNAPTGNEAVVQFVRAAQSDTAGTIEGFPTAAFDWNTFAYYSTYVTFHDVSGTVDRVYVRSQTGAAEYSWDTPANEEIVGTPRWITTGTTHYLYVATASGKVYRLIDDGSSLTADNSGNWAGAANPFDCNCTIVTPLAMNASNLYWGGTQTGPVQLVWTLGQESRAQPMGSPFTITPVITSASPGLWLSGSTSYMFIGLTGNIIKLNVSNQTLDSTNTSPGSASVRGRVSVGSGRVFAAADNGNVWALDPNNFAAAAIWQHTVASGNTIMGSLLYDSIGQVVHVGTEQGKIAAINSSGAALAGYPLTPDLATDSIRAAPLYINGILMFGTTTGKLYIYDRTNGTAPVLIQKYYFGPTQSVSGIGYDSNALRYMVTTADPTTKDGRLYYFDAVTDPSVAK